MSSQTSNEGVNPSDMISEIRGKKYTGNLPCIAGPHCLQVITKGNSYPYVIQGGNTQRDDSQGLKQEYIKSAMRYFVKNPTDSYVDEIR